jgi:formylglycine-generating enzyme required for sulfatase activity
MQPMTMMRAIRCVRLILAIGGVLAAAQAARGAAPLDRTFRECADCPEMVAIPAGKFLMGSPAAEPGRFDAEGPQHEVSVRAFALGKYEVTIAEFLVFLRQTGFAPAACDPRLDLTWHVPGGGLAYPPGQADSPRQPASCLSWNAAEAYIAWLNARVRGLASAARSGAGPYRLPSEAEWEYAARAGTRTQRWWGDAIGKGNANCNGCGSPWDNKSIADAGSFGPNPFGLYDMLGNVWQWVGDCWNDSYVGAPADGSSWMRGDCSKRVLRGGSWRNLPVFARSAARSPGESHGEYFDPPSNAGFRIARALP